MNELDRMSLLWEYLTDVYNSYQPFIETDEIEAGDAYFDAENCEIVLDFSGKKCRVLIEELEKWVTMLL